MTRERRKHIFKSWLGDNYKRMSHLQIYNMNDLYIRLFRRKVRCGLGLNGNNFISKNEVAEETFAGKLGLVLIEGPADLDEAGLIGGHENMELVQFKKYGEEYWFILRDIPAADLEALKTRSDIDYLAIMTGVEL